MRLRRANRMACLLLSLAAVHATAQVCRISVAGLNRNRRVLGNVNVECPGAFHSAPFGNWGVTSNFGNRDNSRQFEGWCKDLRVCDNSGNCSSVCGDGWFEWNSCTDDALFKAPNCDLYNDQECTQQKTVTGINVHGTRLADLRVGCPIDTDGDGQPDLGGCREIAQYTHGTNFISLYELDPPNLGTLVQTMYFPATPVRPNCGPLGCIAAGSEWVGPVSYDSPAAPVRVQAEMAMVINSGIFVDEFNACRAAANTVRGVSAASYRGTGLAPDSLASLFGSGLADRTEAATSTPLPETLAGTSVQITDSSGTVHRARLLLASPRQINLLIPATTALGPATVAVWNNNVVRATGTLLIELTSPGVFSANADGVGVAAAVAVRVKPGGAQTVEAVFQCDANGRNCVPLALDLGPEGDQLIVLLFGTGLRGGASNRTTIGGVEAAVLYSGAQPTFSGLDQVNVLLPRALAGRGDVDVLITIDGKAANPVLLRVK